MWSRLQAWLNRPPIVDPVDRRNAFFMQLLLIFEGTQIPLKKLYLYHFNENYRLIISGSLRVPHFALFIDLGTDLAVVIAAWLGVWLIRRGSFRTAVSIFLTVLLSTAVIAYASFGYLIWRRLDLVPVEALALSSLMLGRRALWSMYGGVILIFIAGMTRDFFHDPGVRGSLTAYDGLVSVALGYLLLVIIFDRASSALRQSLAESNSHRLQLQHEMAERERTREQLLQSQKMDAVGQLASGIAHDLNNVLGIVLAFALERHRLDEPGAMRNEDTHALADALEGVEMAARRGASVSRKLLNFSRQEVTHDEIFDAADTLRELEPLLRQMMPPSVRLQFELSAMPLPIRFDRSQFELALLNLASNARDAMSDGGTLTLIAVAEAPGTIRISLRDTGSGMSEAVQQRVFEPFYTTKPADQGTGLGLTVIYGLIDRAGGRIAIDSAPGTGTTFHLYLPVADPTFSHSDDGTMAPVRVLLIDDDEHLRKLLGSALENAGCVVRSAASGAQAEQIVADDPAFPDILVCDNRLTDTDGATLLGRLRHSLPATPTILISAYLHTDGQPLTDNDPLSQRLPKPFAPSQLVTRVLATTRSRRAMTTEPQASTKT